MVDFNDLEICDIGKLEQVVKVPTRKDATLDLILTNANNEFYKNPVSLPSIHNSDHLCVLFEPHQQRKKTAKKYITTRRFRKSAMQNFGSWITKFKCNVLSRISDVNLKIAYFFSIIWIMIDIFFPSMKIVITENDKKWITSEIKHLIAERQKAYMSGNFDLAKHLAKKIKQEIKKAKINYNTYNA